MQSTTDLPFKFRFVQNGQARGLRAKAASTSSDALVLDGEPIRYEDILDTTSQDKRLVLALAPTVQLGQKTAKACREGGVLALEVKGVQARDLERTIDLRTSALADSFDKSKVCSKTISIMVIPSMGYNFTTKQTNFEPALLKIKNFP